MQNQKVFSAFQFQIYPLQLFILFVGFCIGLIIGSLNRKKDQFENSQKNSSIIITSQRVQTQNKIDLSIISYCLKTGQSFQNNGTRCKLFKGHIYEYHAILNENQQKTQFEVNNLSVTKIKQDGEWNKLYNIKGKLPRNGKYYFQIYVVKNEYFIKREGSQKVSNIAVSRTDIVVGFFIVKTSENEKEITDSIQRIEKQSEKQFNNVDGISGYGFNGRIYSNGELRVEERVIKKNKVLTVYVNRDQGYIAYEVEGQAVGFSILPKEKPNTPNELVPFLEMYAIGTSLIVSS